MIMRIWHGWTSPQNADAYEQLLKTEILPGIHRIDGYQGAYLLRRDDGAEVEFITITTWDSWDAIQRFSSDGHTGAVVPENARKLLARFDEHSQHYTATWNAGVPAGWPGAVSAAGRRRTSRRDGGVPRRR